jgi:hypothetical protein
VFSFRRVSGFSVVSPVEKDRTQVVLSDLSEGKTSFEEFLPNFSFYGNNLTLGRVSHVSDCVFSNSFV